MIGRRHFGIGGAALALAGAGGIARAQGSKSVLRVVPQAEPQVFDPHQSGVNATQENAALIYDTLFSWDADMAPRPQMVDTWNKSDDGLLYTFTLRPGLKFHDLAPSRHAMSSPRCGDCWCATRRTRSLPAWWRRSLAKDERSFTLRLKAPFGYVEFLLCGSNGVIGRHHAREGCADRSVHADQVTHRFGPVPLRRGRVPSRRELVYEKFAGYIPRPEPPSGFAGGKRRAGRSRGMDDHARCGRGLCGAAPRRGGFPGCAAARPAADRRERSATSSSARSGRSRPTPCCASTRLHPPFNNVKARQAVAHAVSQQDYMSAAYGDPKYWRECYAFWVCGSSNGTEAGSEAYRKPDLEKARTLVKESGYDGRPVVLIGGSDVLPYQRMSLITADLLKTDRHERRHAAQRLGQRGGATRQEGPAVAGRLESFPHQRQRRAAGQPADQSLHHHHLRRQEFSWVALRPGGEDMRMQYIRETDPAKQKAVLEAMHRRLWEVAALCAAGSVQAAVPVAQQRQAAW